VQKAISEFCKVTFRKKVKKKFKKNLKKNGKKGQGTPGEISGHWLLSDCKSQIIHPGRFEFFCKNH
jgi:ribosomal silencing factor RsfS